MDNLLIELSKVIEKIDARKDRHDEALDFSEQEWDYKKYDFHLGAREAYEASSSYLRGLKALVERAMRSTEI